MKYITSTEIYNDHNKMLEAVTNLVDNVGWGSLNQILLNSRPGDQDPWHDGTGTVINRQTGERIINETDFTKWNNIPNYLLESLKNLAEARKIKFGRIRIMKLRPQFGLSVHKDFETRYHYVITTNPKCYFGFSQFENQMDPAAICWHMPVDSQWHHIDTTKYHFVYNGGQTDRIHIVACALNE